MQVAAALALGAAGVVMDSGFAATKERLPSLEGMQQKPVTKVADTKQMRLYGDPGAKDLPAGVNALTIGDQSSLTHGTAALAEVSQA